MADGSLVFDTRIDTDGFKQGTNTIKKQANDLGSTLKKIGGIIGAAYIGKKIGRKLLQAGSSALDFASDLQETQNVVDVAFGEMTYKMEEFADTAIETYGISKLTAKKTGSSYMAMAKGMNMVSDVASDMSIKLTGLSADMASFYNISQDDARQALTSIFTGETETLKRYGILITEVNLQEYARQQGIAKSISKMTQQEKVMLRYNYVLNATALAQGDFARTSDSWANQTRILSERWKEFLGIVGNGLIQVLTPTVKFLNTALSYMTAFAKATNQVLTDVFGFKQVTQSTQKATSGIEELGDSVVSTSKKIDKSVSSIDELNILSDNIAANTESAANSLNSLGSASGGIDYGSYVSGDTELEKKISSLKEKIEPFAETIKKLWDTASKWVTGIGSGLIDFLRDLKGFGSAVFEPFAPVFKALGGAIGDMDANTIKTVGYSLGILFTEILVIKGASMVPGIISSVKGAIETMLTVLMCYPLETLAVGLVALFGALFYHHEITNQTDFDKQLENIENVSKSIKESSKAIDERVKKSKDYVNNAGAAETELAKDLGDKYFTLAEKENKTNEEKEVMKQLASDLCEYMPDLNGYIDEETGLLIIQKDEFSKLITKAKEYYKTLAAKEMVIQAYQDQIDAEINLKTATENHEDATNSLETAEEKLQERRKFLMEQMKKTGEVSRNLDQRYVELEADVKAAKKAVTKSEDALKKAQTTYDTTRTHVEDLTEIMYGYRDAVKTSMKTSSTKLSNFLKEFEEATKKTGPYAVEMMKNFKKEVENFKLPTLEMSLTTSGDTLGMLSGKFKATSYSTPHLATGTVVPANYGNFLATLGDNKKEPEIVSPISTMKQALKEALAESGNNNGSINLTVNLDGEVVYKNTVKHNNRNTRMTGHNALLGGI